MRWSNQNRRRLKILLITLLICPSLISLETVCSQDQSALDIATVLSKLDAAEIDMELMHQALPRLTEDRIIFQLRGGDPDVLRGINLESENDLKKCLIIGAYFTAAKWEWAQFMRGSHSSEELDQLKFAMEDYLININHRLKNIDAPQELLVEIDAIKSNFSASGKEKQELDIKMNAELIDAISERLQAFMLTSQNYSISFKLGEWLVWEAELSNLCLSLVKASAKYLREVMNQSYRNVNFVKFINLTEDMFANDFYSNSKNLVKSLSKLQSLFLVENQKDVKLVQTEVVQIFDIFDVRFPSLRI